MIQISGNATADQQTNKRREISLRAPQTSVAETLRSSVSSKMRASPFARARKICCGNKMCWKSSETFFVVRTQKMFPRQMFPVGFQCAQTGKQCFLNNDSSFPGGLLHKWMVSSVHLCKCLHWFTRDFHRVQACRASAAHASHVDFVFVLIFGLTGLLIVF